MKINRRSYLHTNIRSMRNILALVALVALIGIPLFSTSSASSFQQGLRASTTSTPINASGIFPGLPGRESSESSTALLSTGYRAPSSFPLVMPQSPETLTTYEYPGCTVPKNSFNLGETVCVKVTGAPLGTVDRAASGIAWVSPYGSLTQGASIVTDPQTGSYPVPLAATQDFTDVGGSTVTVDNRGVWRIYLINAGDASVRAVTSFTVRDPAKAFVDLSVTQGVTIAGSEVSAGSGSLFDVFVSNKGPDAAQSIVLADTLSDNASFSSLTETTGFGFDCGTPVGLVSTCTLASLPAGATAHLTLSFSANGDTPAGAIISNLVTVSSSAAPCSPDLTCEIQPDDNSSIASATVPTPPAGQTCSLNCRENMSVVANATQGGNPGAFVSFGAATGAGNCGAQTATFPGLPANQPASGAFYPVGTTIVSVTSETGGGSCSFTVTVVQGAPPSIACPANQTVTAPSGETSASVTPGTPLTNPSTGVTVVGVRSDDPVCNQDDDPGCTLRPLTDPYPIGVTTIAWTVTDSNGLNSSCTQRITVIENSCGGDTEPPTITAPPAITAQTGPNSTTCGVALSPSDDELGSPVVSDNCAVTVTSDIPAGGMFPVGVTTVHYLATDGAGNTATASQVVTVIDNTAPLIAAPANASYTCPSEVPGGSASQATRGEVRDEDGNLLPPGPPYDNCGVPSVGLVETNNGGAGSSADPRIITRTFTATDSAGLISTAVQTITVADGVAPTISAPADANYQCISNVPAGNINQAVASDNCAAPTVTLSETNNGGLGTPASPRVITRTFTATDAAGNASSAAQTITVNDTTPPVISCPANIEVYLPLNSTATSMAVSYPTVTATDNCSTPTITGGPASGSVFPVGTTTVSKTATDVAGNTSSCSFTVTVLYNFTGFFSPVGNLPTLNTVNAGRAVPLKFSLSGNKGLSIFATGSPYTVSLNCSSSDPGVDVAETTTAGGSSLSYGPDQYHYTWKTENSWAGTCRQLVIKLNDGSEHRANFKFK